MYLIPKPKKISVGKESLLANSFDKNFGELCSKQVLHIFGILEKETSDNCKSGGKVKLSAFKNEEYDSEEYSIKIDANGIKISAGDERGVFYAIQTLRQIVQTEKCFPYCEIYDKPDFAFRGIQNDTTRGRVPSVVGLKKMADMCAFLKINKIALYFEH